MRRNENNDTPLPPETPLGQNPPAGAVIDYVIRSRAGGPVTLEILDSKGDLVRRFSSEDKIASADAERYFAAAWLKPEPPLSAAPGHHRIVWDMRSERPKSAGYDFSIAAVWGEDTPIEPDGILVPPGKYSARLTVGGKSQTQSFTLRMDPRVHTTAEDLARQYDAAKQAQELMNLSFAALNDAKELQKRKPSAAAAALASGKNSFAAVNSRASAAFQAIESADAAPTVQAVAELESARADFERLLAIWKGIQNRGGGAGRGAEPFGRSAPRSHGVRRFGEARGFSPRPGKRSRSAFYFT